MTLPAFGTTDDMAARLGVTFNATDEARAQAALDDASGLIRYYGQDWVTTPGSGEDPELADVPPIVTIVCYGAAIRSFRNPAGIRSETVGSTSYAYADFSAGVYLTDAETAQVRKAAGISTLSSITLESPYKPPLANTIFVGVDYGGDAFPLYAGEDPFVDEPFLDDPEFPL